MGGFHLIDILIVVGAALAIFGPKTLQSWARSAGKGAAHAKDMKDKLMSDLPMEDIAKMTNTVPQVPRNSRQIVERLLASDKDEEKKASTAQDKPVKNSDADKTKEVKVSEP